MFPLNKNAKQPAPTAEDKIVVVNEYLLIFCISFNFRFVIYHIFIVLKLCRNHDYEFFTIISHFSQNVLFDYIISALFYKTLLFKYKICVFVFSAV